MLDRLDAGIILINRALLIVILGIMSVLIFANVLFRFLTTESIVWAEEIARHLMIWLTFLGSGLVLRYGGHVAVDNLQDVLPGTVARALRTGLVLLMLGFFATMTVLGFHYALFQWEQTTPVTQIPFGLVYSAMPIGFMLMTYHLLIVARAFVRVRTFDSDEEFEPSASTAL